MLGALIIGVATLLTCIMFITRERMLGWPSAIFWIIAGGYYYRLVVRPWVDIEYYMFFASAAMTIFCFLAQFALREANNKKTDEDEYVDEVSDTTKYIDEGKEESDVDSEGMPSDESIDRPSRKTSSRDRRRRRPVW